MDEDIYMNSVKSGNLNGQGAIEYKLILAVVLFIVAAGIGILAAVRPPALSLTGTASKKGDNIVFTPSPTMVPAVILDGEWGYAIYRDATKIYPSDVDWAQGLVTLEQSIPVELVATGNKVGDKLKIKYKGSVFDTIIRE